MTPFVPSLSRRALLGAGLAAALPVHAHAQRNNPRAITVVVPFGAGGSVDAIGRSLAEGMARHLDQPVVVENRAGASGAIGCAAVARAPADGHTLLLGASTTHAVLPNVQLKLAYDPLRDFTPISLAAEVENALVVHPSVPARTLAELVTWCKERKGQVAYGSSGAGGITHLAGELYKSAAGIEAVHVPYKASSEVDVALMGGQLQFAFATLASAIPHIRSGRMHALALASAERSPFLPELPTTAQAGFPSVIAVSWAALYGPAGLPAAQVTRLHAAADAALRRPELRQRFDTLVARALPSTPQGLATYQARDYARWGKVVPTAGIRLEG